MSDTEMGDGRSSPTPGGRHEKSLGLLTSKFVELLQNAEGGVLDLKKVATYMNLSPWTFVAGLFALRHSSSGSQTICLPPPKNSYWKIDGWWVCGS